MVLGRAGRVLLRFGSFTINVCFGSDGGRFTTQRSSATLCGDKNSLSVGATDRLLSWRCVEGREVEGREREEEARCLLPEEAAVFPVSKRPLLR